jgi:O-antigen/teichoic acid export membrane protein
LLPCIWWFGIPPPRLGIGGGSSPCEHPNPRGPLSRVWVSIATCFFFPLFFLFHIFVVVFVFPPASTSIRSLYLSLSLIPLDASYISIFSGRISSSVSAKKTRPVQS